MKKKYDGQTPGLISPLNTFIIPELKPERTAREIYQKWHGYHAEEIAGALEQGTKEELEHTPFRYISRIIASHHIYKHGPKYYPALRKMEKGL